MPPCFLERISVLLNMDKLLLEKLKTLTILYAEDEEGIRKNIAKTLQYYVKKVIEASCGEEALTLYQIEKPDIVFTDIMMPGSIDGIELVKIIRKENTKIPIVIITAHTDKDYLLKAVQLHLEQYIVKPINLKNLKETLMKCVEVISSHRSIDMHLPLGYLYDFHNKVLSCNGEEIKLTRMQIAFFEILLHNKHRIVTYNELQECVWQDQVMTDSALKSLVKNLRQKFPKEYIVNLSGIGYKLVDR